YLPGENTLQINLWEIVNKNIYKGEIIYPDKSNGESLNNNPADLSGKEIPRTKRITQSLTHSPASKNSKREIPIHNDLKEKKIFTINAKQLPTTMSPLEKGEKAIEKGNNLLICGEEGTGKKTFASELLKMTGKPFSKINFRTINPSRLDEELSKITEIVSQKKFKTFLFLNVEVLPSYIQEQFTDLQHIQIITTMNISDKSELSKLNRKFYYQISSSVISLEPLRARKEDLQDLIGRIINKNHSHAVISDNAMEILRKHNWPGNLNELDSVISRACMETSSVITAEIINDSLDTLENDLDQWQKGPLDKDFNLHNVLGDVAMHYIMLALELSGGKKSKAAQMLGFSNYQTLSNWIKKYEK
ncbi:MAG: sigma 54-interacting transcriptional regulator, partial [Spirochaetaceae bacterium]|nr:sigma 54-interacting transcriptional regulator [Spirochaetaceae bacterium]